MKNSDVITGNVQRTLSGVSSQDTPAGQTRATNFHSYVSQISEVFPYSYSYAGKSRTSTSALAHWYYSGNPQHAGMPDLAVKLDNELISQANQAKIEFLSEAAEAKETVEGIGAVAIRVYKAAKATRQGQFVKALSLLGVNLKDKRDLLKTPSDFWLAYQFGVKPLVSLVNELNELKNDGFQPQPTKIKAKESITWTEVQETYAGYMKIRITSEHTHVIRAGATISFENPSDRFIHDYGFDNPVTALWQIVPYSFLIDYFLPVGDWLDANFSYVKPAYSAGWKTTVTKSIVTVSVIGITDDAPLYRDSNGNILPLYSFPGGIRSKHEYLRYRREPYSPTFSLVANSDPLSLNQSLNIIALLFSKLK